MQENISDELLEEYKERIREINRQLRLGKIYTDNYLIDVLNNEKKELNILIYLFYISA